MTTDSFNMDILNIDSFKEKATTVHLKQGQLEQTGTFLTKKQLEAVLRIRIRRIRVFLGLLDWDGSFYHQVKIVRKTLIRTVLLLLFDFYLFIFLKNDVNVPSKSKRQKHFLKN